ncbi:N-acetyl-gamma-glutamyl-phosphate reductase [Acetohalobium arabaticum]|uniref:N-acetyl-gamma-glutamyl-phosphate reductase n=1 Tax=Acetohalobium arabaticum (strain ATCC 49924 / DSM 5501 / Z-7288) TaxID=574087 RepID=D9QRB7_ACEAZ|nr:N-acetyl-gamma-glutamyl-phosphate reductase [Acetohalobium arabaticum]ADL13058.1 N-acetyl-gamma-glutamyl-phosphate reductase [Acetohalobium arabaticum DSM 5501]
MIKAGIIGATGYAGAELVRLLTNHSKVEIEFLTSRSFTGQKISEVYPALAGIVDLKCEEIDIKQQAKRVDIVFTALPHGVSMSVVPELIKAGVKVIDLSGDYRYSSQKIYEDWYQQKHESSELIDKAVYGLPELNKEEIKEAGLVANPGCYPTSATLALAPVVEEGLVDSQSIIIDAKSGVTGAGRKPSRVTHFSEVAESFKAYKVGEHRHTSEIEQNLAGLSAKEVILSFTPHLVPMKRGILSTIYADLTQKVNSKELIELYQKFYSQEPFARIRQEEKMPEVKEVTGSNYCDLGIKLDKRTGRLIIISVIDNLIKGASGQAIQNLNLMSDLDEKEGLDFAGIIP